MRKLNRPLTVAALLVVLVNTLILGGVALNRRTPPDATLVLSERELSPAIAAPFYFGNDENSGLTLELRWAVLPPPVADQAGATHFLYPGSESWGPAAWLDRKKLAALGFDVARRSDEGEEARYYEHVQAREVLLVLEMNADAYQSALQQIRTRATQAAATAAADSFDASLVREAQRLRESARRLERESSRLYVVDAGLDAEALRSRYPDRTRYAIVRGSVRPQVVGQGAARQLFGRVAAVHCADLTVPERLRAPLPPRPLRPADRRQPFQVMVAFGRRFEPWIVGASRTAPNDSD
jgi:Domain of unknown function (DUF4824)